MLVVTTGDLEQVTLELIAEGVTDNLIERKPISPIVLIIRVVCNNFFLYRGRGGVDLCGLKIKDRGLLTSVPMRFSMKGRSLRSSSTSTIFCDPLAG